MLFTSTTMTLRACFQKKWTECSAAACLVCKVSPHVFLGFGGRGRRGKRFVGVELEVVEGGVGDGFEASGLGRGRGR